MFVRGPNPIWFFVDFEGQPLNDEYWAFFLTNTLPYLPQNIYRDPQGNTIWTGDKVQFQPGGTLPDNLYFDPTLVYRIEVRHGSTQDDELLYEINNYVPPTGGGDINNTLSILTVENQIANGQFSNISFVSPLEISTAGTYEIAPGWEFVVTGTGNTTITQLILSGDQNIVNNPPYALEVENSGWTTAFLRQRFSENGAIWANGAVSMSITARADTDPEEVSLIYAPSSPGVSEVVATGMLGTGDYEVLEGAIDLPASVNSGTSDTAYVDMIIQLPVNGTVELSNVQAIGQSVPLPNDFDPLLDIPKYQQESEERTQDHLFHVYQNELLIKPKKSLLAGWNFPLNPFQFNTTTVTTQATQTTYIADQTILHQEAASQVQTGKNVVGERGNLLVKAVASATTTRFALIQYIDPSTIRPYWSYVLSSLARARIVTSHGTSVRLKARLIYRASLPATIGAAEPISGWSASSDPTFSGGWTAIAPVNDPAYVLPNAYASGEGTNAYPAFAFDGFTLPTSTNANMTLGIVIYTMDNMNSSSGTEDSIEFDKISLIPSQFAGDAYPETYDDCLKECEFYYEKSYDDGVTLGTANGTSAQLVQQSTAVSGGNDVLIARAFTINYKRTKRAVPSTVSIYSRVAGTINSVTGFVRSGGNPSGTGAVAFSTNWTVLQTGANTITYIAANDNDLVTGGAAGANPEGFINFNYTIDSRLGV